MDNRHLVKHKPKHIQLIEEAYRDLFNRNNDMQIKLSALDLVANFIDNSSVKARLESLYEQEDDEKVRCLYRKIFAGKHKTTIQQYNELQNEIDSSSPDIDQPKTDTNLNNLLSTNFRYLKLGSSIN